MQINVKQFLEESGITEPFYPGKRLVHQCRQNGEFKSHCIVLDWRDPGKIRMEIKAGLSGRDLEAKKLKHYPVCFQTPTYVDIEIAGANDDEDEESRGKSGGGGKSPAIKKAALDDVRALAREAFDDVIQGKFPELGTIVEMVVMGVEIAKESYGRVMQKMSHQLSHFKITATDLLAVAGDFVTKYTPPSFMQPRGDEDKVYKYDREKNENIGFGRPAVG